MKSPQTENGYIKIANELWDALTGIRIPGEVRQVLDYIFRKTYGYNKKILVTSGSYVSAGQQIALVGTAPGSNVGSLHFEVWRQKKAVDPAFYLKT